MKTQLTLVSLFLAIKTFSQDISLVADINTSPVSVYDLEHLFAFRDRLYFCTGNNTFVYDGIAVPRLAFAIRPVEQYEFNHKLYFSSYDDSFKGILWEYDGLNPPLEIKHFDYPNYTLPHNFTSFVNKLYFALDDGIHGEELWVYDFANPPLMAADVYTGGEGSDPSDFIAYGNKLFFIAGDRELWAYDGSNPPEKIMDLGWGLDHTTAVINNKLCFAAEDGEYGMELFEYDGVNPPVLVSDIEPGSGSSGPEDLQEMNKILYYTASDSMNGKRFWQYDGFTAPVLSAVLNDNIGGSVESILKKINGKLYIQSSIRDTSGYELMLWVYDGISSPEKIVGTYQTSYFYWLTEADGILYFVTHVAHSSAIPWAWDGINPPVNTNLGSTGSSGPNNLVSLNNTLYFLANDGMHGFNIWETKGASPPGTLGGADLPPLPWNTQLTAVNNNLYLLTDSNVWVTDGINPLSGIGTIYYFGSPYVFRDTLYYVSCYNNTFRLTWFDGTNPPVFLGEQDESGHASWAEFQGGLYFSGWDAGHGTELWEYDVNSAPVMLSDLAAGPGSSYPDCLTVLDTLLYFEASCRIWAYNGQNSPKMVPGEYCTPDYKPRKLYAFNHRLYFEGYDESHGYEPWVYDGVNPPKILADLDNKPYPSGVSGFTGLGHTLYFASEYPDGIWACDISDSVRMVKDVNNDCQVYSPGNLFTFGNKLYFSAYQYFIGEELFVLSQSPDTTLTVQTCGRYDFNGLWLTGSGTYYNTIPGSAGIDSIIVLNLEVKYVNTNVSAEGQLLQAVLAGAGYQWVDCRDSYAPVAGAVGQSFIPQGSGEYAVIITDSGCVDTSACYTILVTGLPDDLPPDVSLFPNPNRGSFSLDLGRVCKEVAVSVSRYDGVVILKEDLSDIRVIDLDLDSPPGIYVVKVLISNREEILKMAVVK